MEDKNIHENHRKRVQQRVSEYGFVGMAEHEVLEYLLFFVIPRRDTNPIAHRLIQRFGGLCGVLEAGESELLQVEGIGPAAARLLHAMLPLQHYYVNHRKRKRITLREPANAIEYVEPLFEGKVNEEMYLIALDDNGYPLRSIFLGEGLPNEVLVSTSKLAREAVASGGTGAIIAHNHPRGFPIPSQKDMIYTGSMVKILAILGINVIDHIIVSPEGSLSMAATGRMPFLDAASGQVQYPRCGSL